MAEIGFRLYICAECGKHFIPAPEHAYKNKNGMFCSWHCNNANQKKIDDSENAKRKASLKKQRERDLIKRQRAIKKREQEKAALDMIAQFTLKDATTKPRGNASKAVLQFDMDGNFIKRHTSLRNAADSLGKGCSALSKCLSGNYRNQSFGGFLWRYEKGFDTGNDEY
jgi:hypothetical protein